MKNFENFRFAKTFRNILYKLFMKQSFGLKNSLFCCFFGPKFCYKFNTSFIIIAHCKYCCRCMFCTLPGKERIFFKSTLNFQCDAVCFTRFVEFMEMFQAEDYREEAGSIEMFLAGGLAGECFLWVDW